jgi:tRNA 2-thiouridine synthesizing protein A
MLLHERLRTLENGAIVRILATDPSTRRDIPKFCRYLRHELLEMDNKDGVYSFIVRKHPHRK